MPKDHERYLIAAALGQHFTEASHVEALEKLRRAHRKDEQAWLWFTPRVPRPAERGRRGTARDDPGREDEAPSCARRCSSAWPPSGASRRYRSSRRPGPDSLPRKGVARTLLLESAASVLLALRDVPDVPGYAEAARAVVDLLALDDVSERSKLVIARHLARTFRLDRVTTDHAFWRRMLASLEPVASGGETVAGRPRFFGLEAAGSRVVYVIDLSDSMLDPLTEREKRDARAHGPEGIEWAGDPQPLRPGPRVPRGSRWKDCLRTSASW